MQEKKFGLVQVFFGNGKGKTTAALGTAFRALGRGCKVHLVQVMKKGITGTDAFEEYGELAAAKKFENFSVERFGFPEWVIGKPKKEHTKSAKEGLESAQKAAAGGKFDIVIFDECLYAVQLGLLTEEDIIGLIEKKAAKFSKIRLSKEFVGYAILTVLVVLLLVDFSFFLAKRLNGFPGSVDFPDQLAGVGIMKYIGDEGKSTGEMFRVYNMAQKTVIGASGYHYYAQAGIEDAKGGGGIWINDYVTYLGTSEAYNFPNMLGNINIKYIISDSELNSDQLRFIQKFNECKTCSSWEAYGPYLYELKNYLPRASNFQKMVIFLGEKKNSDKAVYSIMANNLADLNKLALVSISSQKELDSISGEDLLRAGMIILVDSSLVQANAAKLQSYVSGGGKLAPDIFAGENNIEEGTLVSMLRNNSDSAYAQMKIEDYAPQKYSVALNGEKGLLLLAEKFFMFPDWKARVNGKEAMIFQVNAMDSGIFLDGQIGKLEVEYRPHAYNLGKPISIITLLFLIFYFSMHLIYGKKSKSRTIRFIIG